MPAADFDPAALRNAETLIELAVAEDLGTGTPCLRLDAMAGRLTMDVENDLARGTFGDVTSTATIPADARGSARFVARAEGLVAGLPVLAMVARRFGLTWYEPLTGDGDRVTAGAPIAHVAGPMRELLMMERTALNFLQRLSGIATLTDQFVSAVAGTRAEILDTRKTTPGWRALEKYAVRCGGGVNHRSGLFDAVLIKDNHLAWVSHLGAGDPVRSSVEAARRVAPEGMVVEVEVDNLHQLDRALECHPDVLLVDNLGPDALAEAVRRRDDRAPGVLLEASGGVNLRTVADLARTGVDRISVGALTHSAPALDIGLDFEGSEAP
jgi:nicotinate-nucleotide pyrophosphorylase (carboxylating)